MSNEIIHLNDNNFEEEIKKQKLIIVDFWAAWCGPCQMFGSILEDFAKENLDVACAKLNVDESPITANRFAVRSIPTILFFKDGNLAYQQVGVIPKEFLKEIIEKLK